MHKGGTLGQLKLSTRRPSSGRCRPQTTSANNDVPRLAAHLLRPTTCPTPSRARKEEARATISGTRGRRACGGTTSRTNRTRAERRLAAHLLRPTTCPTPSRGRKEEARATTSGTRGRRACGGTTSRTNRQRRAARLASDRGRHAAAVRGRRWSRINAARCNEAKSFQAPASSASWRGLHGPSRRPGGR